MSQEIGRSASEEQGRSQGVILVPMWKTASCRLGCGWDRVSAHSPRSADGCRFTVQLWNFRRRFGELVSQSER